MHLPFKINHTDSTQLFRMNLSDMHGQEWYKVDSDFTCRMKKKYQII